MFAVTPTLATEFNTVVEKLALLPNLMPAPVVYPMMQGLLLLSLLLHCLHKFFELQRLEAVMKQ